MQKRVNASLRMLSAKCVYKSYIYLIYMYKQDLALNKQQRLIYYKLNKQQWLIYYKLNKQQRLIYYKTKPN